MRKEDLDRALGQTPQSFTEAMDRTLHGLKEEKDVKRVAFRTVILVAVIILLLCATAFALMGQGLEWYYNNIFTAYQEHEPEKHQAIMQNLQTDLPQAMVEDPEIAIAVTEASWAQEQNALVMVITASPLHPEQVELHPINALDADGGYGDPDCREEHVMEHMLWTTAGYGPVEDMLAPGKKLLLLECGTVSMDGISTHGSNTLSDAYVTDTGTVQTIVELPLDFLKDDYIAQQREYLAKNPNNMELKQIVTSMEQLHQRLEQASSVELTIPYTVTTYIDDDEKLYQNGRTGEIRFTLHLPETVALEAPTNLTTLREGDQGEAVSALQERLMALGYLSESSRVYDERTAAALKAFQESNGLPADGIAGPNTQQALYAADAIPKS